MKKESKVRNHLGIYLPDEIVSKILLLLPFELILVCKRLSKKWKNLINDPDFAKRYRHNGSMIVLLYATHLFCVLVRHSNEDIQFPSYTVRRIPLKLNKINSKPSNGTSTRRKILNHELLSGWSNGVACIKKSNGHFVLYNLFTGASQTVEDAPLQRHSEYWIFYGFGYDRFDDDYKIMVVCDYEAWTRDWLMGSEGERFDSVNVRSTDSSLFWVYSFRNRSWKSYDSFPYVSYSWRRSPLRGSYYFNGVLHHSAIPKNRAGKWVIVTYDLHTRKFGEIIAPCVDLMFPCVRVCELDGRLWYNYTLRGKWVTQVQDVGGLWTKLVIIDRSMTLDQDFAYTALYERRDGSKVGLLVCDGKLKWYDFRKNEMEEVNVLEAWEMKQTEQILIRQSEHRERMRKLKQ